MVHISTEYYRPTRHIVFPCKILLSQNGMHRKGSISRLAEMSKSLSRTLSLPRRCRICGKMVYFKSFRCRHCNYVYHRQCADHAEQWFPSVETTKPDAHFGWETFRQFGSNKEQRTVSTCKDCPTGPHRHDSCKSNDPMTELGSESQCHHQLHATETLAFSLWRDSVFTASQEPEVDGASKLQQEDTVGSIGSNASTTIITRTPLSQCPTTKSMDDGSSGTGPGFYRKLFHWFTNRKFHQDGSKGTAGIKGRSISLKHPKEKYGGLGDAESQMIRKRLRLIFSGAGRKLSTSSVSSMQQYSSGEDAIMALQLQQQQQVATAAFRQSARPQLFFQLPQYKSQHAQYCPFQHPVSIQHDINTKMSPCSGGAVFIHRDSGISSMSSSVAQTPSCGECLSATDPATGILAAPSSASTCKTRHVQSSAPSCIVGHPQSPWCNSPMGPVPPTAVSMSVSTGGHISSSSSTTTNSTSWQGPSMAAIPALPLHHQLLPATVLCHKTSAAQHLRSRFMHHSSNATFPYTGGHHHHHHHHAGAARGHRSRDARSMTKGGPPPCQAYTEYIDGGRFSKQWPQKMRTLSLESKNEQRNNLCITWPPVGRKSFSGNDDLDGSESGFEDYETDDDPNNVYMQSPTNLKDTLGEWSIPFRDLKIGRQLRRGRRNDIHRGRWHGEVMIHIYHINTEQETTQFWKEVTSLSMIRHENVALFMGVCIDMSQLAIITSVRKGFSLYDHVHVNRDHFLLPVKVQIARQVAQGMSYLHAKGIIHRKLNSKNILLETKVKVCLLDQGMAQRDFDRDDYGCVPNGHLTYVSPEIMRSLQVLPPKVDPTVPYTKASDVFAFGTVLYELFAEQWPFQGQRPHSVIWQVAKGHTQSLSSLKCSAGIKTLLTDCWTTDQMNRPNFHHILRVLQQNVLLQRRHSTSEPDSLNRLIFGKKSLLPC